MVTRWKSLLATSLACAARLVTADREQQVGEEDTRKTVLTALGVTAADAFKLTPEEALAALHGLPRKRCQLFMRHLGVLVNRSFFTRAPAGVAEQVAKITIERAFSNPAPAMEGSFVYVLNQLRYYGLQFRPEGMPGIGTCSHCHRERLDFTKSAKKR